MRAAAHARLGRLYDTGFNLDSGRQFCSKFVREVLNEACGTSLGEVSTLGALFAWRAGTNVRLWKLWYFGRVPWMRRTITPGSLYADPALQVAFDGRVRDHRCTGIARRAPVPRSSGHDSLLLPVEQDARTDKGGA